MPADSLDSQLAPRCMWTPTADAVQSSHMTIFTRFVNKRRALALSSYDELWQYSVDHIASFWEDVLIYTEVIASGKHTSAIDESISMDKIPDWFAGMSLNFAENCLRFNDNYTAIIATSELLQLQYITYAELREMVRRMAAALKVAGVGVGDRVGGYIANCVEAVVAMLAATSLGAVWSSTSPDFGVTGVLDRFSQIKPKVLFSINAVHYNGKMHDHIGKLKQVVEGLGDAVELVVVIPHIPSHSFDINTIPKACTLDAFLKTGDPNYVLEFVQLPFKHPLVILFSSGTTGKPKCIVHTAGGTLIQHKKEHVIHGNLRREDIFFQYTTTGWMMWNWLLTGLSIGLTIVLFDGSPFKPTNTVLFELIDRLGITVFGTSAKYIQSLQDLNIKPRSLFSLKTLHSIYSTGSPLKPESFDFVYEHIKQDVLLGSITGGTDIISLFAGHNTNLPIYRGELQCRCLGMKIEAWDDNGKAIYGASGDLVCTKAFPCMPGFFWEDPGMAKYRAAYFDRFPGVWYHGDFVFLNPNTKGVIMLGRSDGTLNAAGVRFGSAELYNIIDTFKEVADSLVVGQKQGEDERVCMFLQMADGQKFTPELIQAIKAKIRGQLSPRHVPAVIVEVFDIPYTINGKKVEVAVKRIISGETVVPSGTLRNPESLDVFYHIPELKM